MRSAGARWCDKHGRLECTKQRSRGRGLCHAQAVKGTDACFTHAGKTLRQSRTEVRTAWQAQPGDDGITPRQAAAAMLGLAWRRADLLAGELRAQVEAAPNGNGDGSGHGGGLVGHTYSASEVAGGIYPTGERARALVEIEAAERDRVVRYAKTAHEMGIEDARIALAEQAGEDISFVLDTALRTLGLDPRDEQVRAAAYAALTLLAAQRRELTP